MRSIADAVLEGARPGEVEQLRLLAQGRSTTASPDQLAQIAAKGWLETIGGIHLITLTGRALLERSPRDAADMDWRQG